MEEEKQPPATERVVLHVGCGPYNPNKLHAAFRKEGWRELRLDINPNVKPDIVASMLAMPMIPAASVDGVWSSHNIEHLYAHEVPVALTEFLRVLRPGGVVLLTMPDLQRVAELIVQDKLDEPAYSSPAGPIAPLDILYGHRPQIAMGNVFMAHRTGFTARTLAQVLANAGFERVKVERGKSFDLWAVGYKPAPAAPSAS
jgi:ubiquinone/menaquinone biosynthesis C-methylase UbiE